MFLKRSVSRIFAYQQAIDMRKSFDGLLGIVKHDLKQDPLSGTFYLFINRRRNYLKGVLWDRTGYCLFAKRLERGRFRLPTEDSFQELTEQVFELLLDGISLGSRRRMC